MVPREIRQRPFASRPFQGRSSSRDLPRFLGGLGLRPDRGGKKSFPSSSLTWNRPTNASSEAKKKPIRGNPDRLFSCPALRLLWLIEKRIPGGGRTGRSRGAAPGGRRRKVVEDAGIEPEPAVAPGARADRAILENPGRGPGLIQVEVLGKDRVPEPFDRLLVPLEFEVVEIVESFRFRAGDKDFLNDLS